MTQDIQGHVTSPQKMYISLQLKYNPELRLRKRESQREDTLILCLFVVHLFIFWPCLWDLSTLTRDWIWALGSESLEEFCQGIPQDMLILDGGDRMALIRD